MDIDSIWWEKYLDYSSKHNYDPIVLMKLNHFFLPQRFALLMITNEGMLITVTEMGRSTNLNQWQSPLVGHFQQTLYLLNFMFTLYKTDTYVTTDISLARLENRYFDQQYKYRNFSSQMQDGMFCFKQ